MWSSSLCSYFSFYSSGSQPGWLGPQGTCDNVWRHLGCHGWGWGGGRAGGGGQRCCLASCRAQSAPQQRRIQPQTSTVPGLRTLLHPSDVPLHVTKSNLRLKDWKTVSLVFLKIPQKLTFCWLKHGDCFLMDRHPIIISLIRTNVYRAFMLCQT